MKRKTIDQQVEKIFRMFGKRITITTSDGKIKMFEGCIELLVVHPSIVSTRELFDKVNLGCKKHNSWFLDLKNAYDLIEIPETSYTLKNVNVSNTIALKNLIGKKYDSVGRKFGLVQKMFPCFGKRPLTLHEVLNLAFQYPDIFNEKVHGIQAYGSRFTKEVDTLNPSTDDTMEIYRKGNPGKGFLKLAREQYRYNEDSKIIPFLEFNED